MPPIEPYYIDIAFGIIAILLIAKGWRKGFVRMAGSLLSLVVSIVVSIWGIGWLEDVVGIPFSQNIFWLIPAFLALMGIVGAIVNLLIRVLDLIRRVISVIPGMGPLNRLGGAFIGLGESFALVLAVSYLTVTLIFDQTVQPILLGSHAIGYGIQILKMIGML